MADSYLNAPVPPGFIRMPDGSIAPDAGTSNTFGQNAADIQKQKLADQTKQIISGQSNLSDFQENDRNQLVRYWQSYKSALPQGFLTAQGVEKQIAGSQNFLTREGESPLEWIGSKASWAYNHISSPAISTALLEIHRLTYGTAEGETDGVSGIAEAWDQAHHVSPGQALWMLGLNNKELKKRDILPRDIANGDAAAIKAKQNYFDDGVSKWASGGVDFATNWFADPTILAGKVGKAFRVAKYLKPLETETGVVRGIIRQGKAARAGEKITLKEARTVSNINTKRVQNSVEDMVSYVNKFKDQHGDTAAAKLRDSMPTLRLSANGDVLARALMAAKDENETRLILKASIGDATAKGIIAEKNAKAESELIRANKTLTNSYKSYSQMSDAEKLGFHGQMLKANIDAQRQNLERLNEYNNSISDQLATFDKIDALRFNSVTTPIGVAARESLKAGQGYLRTRAALKDGSLLQRAGSGILSAGLDSASVLYRSWNGLRPNGYINVHEIDSYRELDANLKNAKITPEARQKLVSEYIKLRPDERGSFLARTERNVVGLMADRHGLGEEVADAVYKDYVTRRANLQSSQRFSAATISNSKTKGVPIPVDHFDDSGASVMIHPILSSQLANHYVGMDFSLVDNLMRQHGGMIKSLLARGADNSVAHGIEALSSTLDSFWKTFQLARIGYPIRAVGDDFIGQLAAFGPAMMAARAKDGVVRNRFLRGLAFHSSEAADSSRLAVLKTQEDVLNNQVASKLAKIEKHKTAMSTMTRRHAIAARQQKIDDLNVELQRAYADIKGNRLEQEGIVNKRASSVYKRENAFNTSFAGAYEGPEGEMFRDYLSGERNSANMFGRVADWGLRDMRNKWDNITVGSHGESKHMSAWLRNINDQLLNDPLARQILDGQSNAKIRKWLQTGGRDHYNNVFAGANIGRREAVLRVRAHVDHVMNPNIPGMNALRKKVARGETLDGKELKDITAQDLTLRPSVSSELTDYSLGKGTTAEYAKWLNRKFYQLLSELPAEHLLKNPLFAQLYRDNVRKQFATLRAQGITHLHAETRMAMETAAREKALRDVKRFTFSMDHETKLAHNMRFFSSFFGARQESMNRWMRIVSEKPETLGKIVKVKTAPNQMGMAVDPNGNKVDAEGYSIDPDTGKRVKVSSDQIRILLPIPDYLGGKALRKHWGLSAEEHVSIPASAFDFVASIDPGDYTKNWAGPWVQLAADHFAKNDPKIADFAEQYGFLPFGTKQSWSEYVTPSWFQKTNDGLQSDSMQTLMFKIMNVEHAKLVAGIRPKEADWNEIERKAKGILALRANTAQFGFGANYDPYQFFRDQYQKLTDTYGPEMADQKFIDKFGDSFDGYMQAQGTNNTGIKATENGWRLSRQYQSLINKLDDPQLAQVIVGTEDAGTYSKGVYQLQQRTPSQAGSKEAQRGVLNARDQYAKEQVNLGWESYDRDMTQYQAELFSRGLTSFNDPGAEDLKEQRDLTVKVLSNEYFPDGTKNPEYNPYWAKEYQTVDKTKYDRRAADMQKIVDDPQMKKRAFAPDGRSKGIRSDIFQLGQWLAQRQNVLNLLAQRRQNGYSDDITAQENEDLRSNFEAYTNQLIEQDTRFAYLHNRFFATDMGYSPIESALGGGTE